MTSIYKNTIIDSDIDSLLDRYIYFHLLVYNWGEITTEKFSEKQINIDYERYERLGIFLLHKYWLDAAIYGIMYWEEG